MIEGMDSNMIYCKKFCKCHNVPPSTTIIKKKFPSSFMGAGITIPVVESGEWEFPAEISGRDSTWSHSIRNNTIPATVKQSWVIT
jgi:hypothetical protein